MLKMLLGVSLMGLAVWGISRLLVGVLPGGKAGEVILLGAGAGTGVLAYFAATAAMGLAEAGLVKNVVKRMLKRG